MSSCIFFLSGLLHALGIGLAGNKPPEEFDDEESTDADAGVVHVLCCEIETVVNDPNNGMEIYKPTSCGHIIRERERHNREDQPGDGYAVDDHPDEGAHVEGSVAMGHGLSVEEDVC